MEKRTIIAKIHTSFDYSQEYANWRQSFSNQLNTNSEDYPWFLRSGGKPFLSEFRSRWNSVLIKSAEEDIKGYFQQLGLQEEYLPNAEITETYEGSWIIDAAIFIASSAGGTYAVLKGISEIPDIVEGIGKLKEGIRNKFRRNLEEVSYEIIEESAERKQLPEPPKKIFEVKDFVIDARPLTALTPREMKSHKIHLSTGVSIDAFTLENLGEEIIKDLKIGLFKSKTKKNNWSFADAYVSYVGQLSSKQTLSKNINDFVDQSGNKLQIDESELPLNIDCWVQDQYGIYLFMYYLEK